MKTTSNYVDQLSPDLRERRRLSCKKFNDKTKEENKGKFKYIYKHYLEILGEDFIKRYIKTYGEQHVKKYLKRNM
jgi:hypothetical protein